MKRPKLIPKRIRDVSIVVLALMLLTGSTLWNPEYTSLEQRQELVESSLVSSVSSSWKSKEGYLSSYQRRLPISNGESQNASETASRYGRSFHPSSTILTQNDIDLENIYGDMELVAQLIQAEAGNQDLLGKQLVADVVYNRVDDPRFPDTIEEVIFQNAQFSVAVNGTLNKAAWYIDEDSFKASESEYLRHNRKDQNVLYFNGVYENGSDPYKHGDHWFSR